MRGEPGHGGPLRNSMATGWSHSAFKSDCRPPSRSQGSGGAGVSACGELFRIEAIISALKAILPSRSFQRTNPAQSDASTVRITRRALSGWTRLRASLPKPTSFTHASEQWPFYSEFSPLAKHPCRSWANESLEKLTEELRAAGAD